MNDAAEKERWAFVAVVAGAAYLTVGIAFAEFARISSSGEIRFFWRLAAWAVSFALLAAHLAFELRRRPPRRAAVHASAGVAFGAFGLAAWINLNALAGSGPRSPLAPLALAVFPLVTGVPAFLGAWAAAALFARLRRGRAA